jgi:hypothetical protein
MGLNWKWRDGPYSIGDDPDKRRVVKGKLSWYQPLRRCHNISLFACAIGVLNYPQLDWQFICGGLHTVPVGSANGEYKVVVDILNFKNLTAQESIDFAQETGPEQAPDYLKNFLAHYIADTVPLLREMAKRHA